MSFSQLLIYRVQFIGSSILVNNSCYDLLYYMYWKFLHFQALCSQWFVLFFRNCKEIPNLLVLLQLTGRVKVIFLQMFSSYSVNYKIENNHFLKVPCFLSRHPKPFMRWKIPKRKKDVQSVPKKVVLVISKSKSYFKIFEFNSNSQRII